MKIIPEQNLTIKHVVVDPDVQESDSFPVGRRNLRLTDITMTTQEGNHVLTYFYIVGI